MTLAAFPGESFKKFEVVIERNMPGLPPKLFTITVSAEWIKGKVPKDRVDAVTTKGEVIRGHIYLIRPLREK